MTRKCPIGKRWSAKSGKCVPISDEDLVFIVEIPEEYSRENAAVYVIAESEKEAKERAVVFYASVTRALGEPVLFKELDKSEAKELKKKGGVWTVF